ncbi:MAG: anion transporter [Gammaproteobacteria bacterium]|nr:MAG: anion transporter [Gammaproteobacteria bacterium]RLA48773.1 MAG: anion transporter [Gammaproteobacteria bacterium]
MSNRASNENLHLVAHLRWYGLIGGPLLALLIAFVVPAQITAIDGSPLILGTAGKVTAGLAVWMAVWWLTEAISIYATALLPLAILPLTGAQSIGTAANAYAHPLIFLFLGGFILALALERWHLHKRFALFILRIVGTQPRRLVGGFMIASATMSMWITNTATTIVMLPIALSVLAMQPDTPWKSRFAMCLLLGVAYSASIGGIGTIVGTTPNMFAASFIENELGQTISFAQWMMIGVPLVILFVPVVWWLMTHILLPLPKELPQDQQRQITSFDVSPDPWNRGAVLTLIIFAATAAAWMGRPLLVKLPVFVHLTDAGIAIISALLLFVIPENIREKRFLMNWETAVKVPWGVLIILGGGLCLAGAIRENGVAELLALQLTAMGEVPPLVMTLLVVALMMFLTELTSNVATTTALVPVVAAIAVALGMEPLKLVIPATMAASCAFMLPVATPPNAIVFGSGLITIPAMARVGFWLNLTGILIVSLLCYFALDIVLPLIQSGAALPIVQ